jgi:type VI secretion system protein ImpH
LVPTRGPLGDKTNPLGEVVRFRASRKTRRIEYEVEEIEQPRDDGPYRMTVTLLGLFGPQRVLPSFIEDLLDEEERQRKSALRDFLDIFHHRFLTLDYCGWEKLQFPFTYERALSAASRDPKANSEAGSDPLIEHVLSRVGLTPPEGIAPESLIFYAPLLTLQTRSASALEQILSNLFGVTVRVAPFEGRTAPEGQEDSLLHGEPTPGLLMSFRLIVGPILTLARYVFFLPGHEGLRALVRWTRMFVGQRLSFDVQLVLDASTVPYPILAADDAEVVPPEPSGEALGYPGFLDWACWPAGDGPYPKDMHGFINVKTCLDNE